MDTLSTRCRGGSTPYDTREMFCIQLSRGPHPDCHKVPRGQRRFRSPHHNNSRLYSSSRVYRTEAAESRGIRVEYPGELVLTHNTYMYVHISATGTLADRYEFPVHAWRFARQKGTIIRARIEHHERVLVPGRISDDDDDDSYQQ